MTLSDYSVIAIMIFVALVTLIGAAYHVDALNASADAYTACVQQQYHTTPAAFYGEQGHYPECK